MLTRAMLLLMALAAPAAAIELELPIGCALGEDCTVQQYFDHDPGPGDRDYACGAASYDGHDGTDIRVKTFADIARGVAVLAAADGVVQAGRDGMADKPVRSEADRKALKGLDCGNGVVVDHGGGWETQYCHMRRGSKAVKPGARVKAGDKLGEVGMSGDAGFPHVHLTVRKDGAAVDPFAPDPADKACGTQGQGLWSAKAAKALAYRPGEVLTLGFADRVLTLEDVEAGLIGESHPRAAAGVLAAHGWLINLRKGDRIDLTFANAAGEALAEQSETLKRDKAQYLVIAGRKRLEPGEYFATLTVTRQKEAAISAKAAFTLQ